MGGGLQNGPLDRWHLHRCHYCDNVMYHAKPAGMSKAEFKWRRPSRDHCVPRCEARNVPNNVVICCTYCNHQKGAMSYGEFIMWISLHGGYVPGMKLRRLSHEIRGVD